VCEISVKGKSLDTRNKPVIDWVATWIDNSQVGRAYIHRNVSQDTLNTLLYGSMFRAALFTIAKL
jgi:hypothetical protein